MHRNARQHERFHNRACRLFVINNDLIRKLGIEGGTVKVAKTRRIKGRAVWYDKLKAQIIGVDELPPEEPVEEGNDE